MSASSSNPDLSNWEAPKLSTIQILEQRMREAREQGALFHVTNPADSWYCKACCVFGKGGTQCWSCNTTDVALQYVPRWGGGCQTVAREETDE